jgi:hypothetical protein
MTFVFVLCMSMVDGRCTAIAAKFIDVSATETRSCYSMVPELVRPSLLRCGVVQWELDA